MKHVVMLAALLATLSLGCNSGPTEPPGLRLCAADYPTGYQVAVCDSALCTPYVNTGDEWVEELTGESGGPCLTPDPDEYVIDFGL